MSTPRMIEKYDTSIRMKQILLYLWTSQVLTNNALKKRAYLKKNKYFCAKTYVLFNRFKTEAGTAG